MAPEQKNGIPVIKVVNELVTSIRDIPKAIREALAAGGGSAIKGNVREAQDLIPEIVRVDHIGFIASIGGGAIIAAQAAQVRVNPDFDFQLTGISAWAEDPGTNPSDIAFTTFQMREAGRSSDVFTTPINMAALAGTAGVQNFVDWGSNGTYIFRAGAEIQPTFAVTAAHTHAARQFGVDLWGVLIRKRPG